MTRRARMKTVAEGAFCGVDEPRGESPRETPPRRRAAPGSGPEPPLPLPLLRAPFTVSPADAEPIADAAPEDRARRIKPSRGVDSLFRNAYRAQLDMLTLAAAKANIMISLNGLLMSLLIISGTHFVSIDGRYAIPIALLLVGCAIATVFAVLAARPNARLGRCRREDFDADRARLLVFEDFSDLDEDDYIDAMRSMLGDRQRVYENMIAHVYRLGATADRKYRRLYYAYTTFMIGVVASVTALLILEGARWWQVPLG